MSVTLKEVMLMCPAFGKAICPYTILVRECKGLAGKCPPFKEDCPFKICLSVGDFVEKLTQMRDTCIRGKAAHATFFKELLKINEDDQKKLGNCPFNAHVCPFRYDAQGKAIISK